LIFVYAQVSTREEQETYLQEAVLCVAGTENIFAEQAFGGRRDRPVLHRMLDRLCPADVVPSGNWIGGRRPSQIYCIIERIEQIGASFRRLTAALDFTTPAGRMFCTWPGVVRSLRGL
jgi:DNA invertase Pin-like site-specific DNA recombinase